MGHDLAALAELYLTFLWMVRQRLHYGPAWQYRWHRVEEGKGQEAAARREKTRAR